MLKLEDFETLALAQGEFVLGRVNMNDFANHDATYDVERILDETLAQEIPAELRKIVRVFRKILNGLLYNPDVSDDITQAALTALVATPDNVCGYTQEMRNHLEMLSRIYPYASKTELDFQLAKGTITRVKVTQPFERGECVIITTADCEPHTPQIYERVTYSNGNIKDIRIAGFRTVEKAGTYRTHCKNINNLWIDNAYGVITA